jgi:peptide-methionine (R)-S-oxide reductase
MAFVVPAGEAVRIERFSVYGRSLSTMEVPRVIRSDTQWRVHLSTLAYQVTRQGDSEPAFSGRYLHNRATGLYRCICCGTALFDSRSRFEPGGGWLSFHAPVSAYNVVESLQSEADVAGEVHHLAVSCRRCDAHLGEVFDDGPPPTELRYRIDSVALYFVPYPPY